eukprot:TRINITY_DN3158_c0_g1_i1.p1 TRINITY_DN3158_c0_g1~~TRINITY_DN3158_c0_g1_i1.p1  ORF type:complete len:955 (+),score=219.98 TRINITY_DN3158_c0_g1_i1:54-2867(+)
MKQTISTNQCASHLLNADASTGTPQQASETADPWAGFYKKSLETRQQQIHGIFSQKSEVLKDQVADHMIENCIGTFGLPLGLGLNFKVNGKEMVVPMATEEPSVIAAVSGAAKLISHHGGFTSSYSGNIMVCQVQLLDVPNIDRAVKAILENENQIIEHGNMFVSEGMIKRGGGVIKVIPRIVPYDKNQYFNIHQDDGTSAPIIMQPSAELIFNDKERAKAAEENQKDFMLIVNVHVDVCEAMGANTINTVAEGVSPFLTQLVGGRAGLQIISNFAAERRAIATFRIPVDNLAYKDKSGEAVARGILEGYAMACADSFRAVTHNKGIMNGIDAAAIALGQDFRAIESGAHAWAARTGSYQPLTHYRLVRQVDQLMFEGTLELPVPIGTRGGAVQSHPTVKYTHQLLQNPDCSTLGGILASVGLAQNFAALRAMASEGIQRGHMSLHSKNIAIQAGVPQELIADVSSFMVSSGVITSAAATNYMNALKVLAKFSKASTISEQLSVPSSPPSSLYVSIKVRDVILSHLVLYDTFGTYPTHLHVKPIAGNPPVIQASLFGTEMTSQWLSNFFTLAQDLRVKEEYRIHRDNEPLQLRLQLLSMLLQLLTFKLLQISPIATRDLVSSMLKDVTSPSGLTSQEKLQLFFSDQKRQSEITPQHVKSKISSFFHEDGIMLDPFFGNKTEDGKEVQGEQISNESDVPSVSRTILSSSFHPDGLILDPFFETTQVVKADDKDRVSAFKVGAPLLLSLWWSLQDLIEAEVTNKALANALNIEQLKAMLQLSNSVGFYEAMPNNLAEFMDTHSSRVMLPFILLSEMVTVDPSHITKSNLDHLSKLGSVMAWKAIILEDLETFDQENTNQLSNSYLFWLHLNGKSHAGKETIATFQADIEKQTRAVQEALVSSQAAFVDTRSLLSQERLRVVRQLSKEILGTSEIVKAKL